LGGRTCRGWGGKAKRLARDVRGQVSIQSVAGAALFCRGGGGGGGEY